MLVKHIRLQYIQARSDSGTHECSNLEMMPRSPGLLPYIICKHYIHTVYHLYEAYMRILTKVDAHSSQCQALEHDHHALRVHPGEDRQGAHGGLRRLLLLGIRICTHAHPYNQSTLLG